MFQHEFFLFLLSVEIRFFVYSFFIYG